MVADGSKLTTAGCAKTLLNDAEDDPAYEDEHEAIEHVAKEAGRGRFRWVLSCIDHRENDDRDENQKAEYRHENQGEAQGRRIEGSYKGGGQDGAIKSEADPANPHHQRRNRSIDPAIPDGALAPTQGRDPITVSNMVEIRTNLQANR